MKKKLLIILQARSSSKRLPNKVLKKINGIPLVVLCYKRLTNKGRQAIVAISNNESDNKLAKILENYKIPFYRGSLNNVLLRYQDIIKKMKPSDLVIRATSDNVVPDGGLVELLYRHFLKSRKNYIQIDYLLHGVPKGIRLEILKARKLLSLKRNLTKFDKEHVTYQIYKNKRQNYYYFKSLISKKKLDNLSLSIDTLKEYKFVKNVFKNLKNPITVSYKKILKICEKYQKQ